MAQQIVLTVDNDYIAFTGAHPTQDIEFHIADSSVFDSAEIEVWTAHLVNDIITPIAIKKDKAGVRQPITFAETYRFNTIDEKQSWYMIKLVNAGANTNIQVFSNYNSYQTKSNKPFIV